MESNPSTVEEQLRHAEETLALVADLATLAAQTDTVELSPAACSALATLTHGAADQLRAARRALPTTPRSTMSSRRGDECRAASGGFVAVSAACARAAAGMPA